MHRGCPFKRFVRPERIDTNSIKTTARNGITMHHMVLHTNHGCSNEENTACTGLPQERWGMRIHGFVDVQFGSWLSILHKKRIKQAVCSLSDLNRFEGFWDFPYGEKWRSGRSDRSKAYKPPGRNRPRDPKAKPGRRSVRNAVGLRRFPFHLFS